MLFKIKSKEIKLHAVITTNAESSQLRQIKVSNRLIQSANLHRYKQALRVKHST